MKITEISYGVTVNLGNYESARIDATVTGETTNVDQAFAELKAWVDSRATEQKKTYVSQTKQR